MTEKTVYALGQLAELFQEPPARVAYVISKYRIKPCQRIGIIRLIDENAAAAIKQGLYLLRTGRYS
jgi:hypothetical protein